ncbi:DUF4274 domain-containing protein [Algibacter sp. TI.3.09]|uniref:DUF4274 domain-containing protein n=1 Tax=Algibacter sp. TI.3.09 TaxID=3121298 RepID=UPI00311F717E
MKKKITTEEFEVLENKIWLEFLEKATPIEIHKSLITSNFDGNSLLLNLIKNNPKTDKGTILVAYWMSSPSYFKEFSNREDLLEKSSFSIDGFDFVEEIEKKYCDGFYQCNEITFDPKSDSEDYDWTSEYDEGVVVRKIPKIMFEKINGKIEIKEYPKDFDNGLPMKPIDYAQKVYDIFEEYEVE